jgi:transcriptional regulator with XRE-family HTH domain
MREVSGTKRPNPPHVKHAPVKIVRLLADLGWDQVRLAEKAGVTESRISRWLKGDGNPRPRQFLAMARAMGVPVEYLIDDREEEKRLAEILAEKVERETSGLPLNEDERLILQIAHRLGLDAAIQRLIVATKEELATSTKRQPAPGGTTGRTPAPHDAPGSRETG